MGVELPAVSDPLGEALHLLRVSGILYCRSEFSDPWSLEIPAMPGFLMLHAVTEGGCWLVSRDAVRLEKGDVALIPHGQGHRLSSAPDLAGQSLFDIAREAVSERYEVLRMGGGGARATVLCGTLEFDQVGARQLTALLPAHILWRSREAAGLLDRIAEEMRQMRPGAEAMVSRLADVLVIQAIREWIEQAPAAQRGWLGALNDPQIGGVISRIHREPERVWMLESMAAEAAMSRSAFAARFTEIVGEPAVRYATRWRMNVAQSWLDGGAAVSEVCHRLGYESEAAFRRAFQRHLGITPGEVRRRKVADSS